MLPSDILGGALMLGEGLDTLRANQLAPHLLTCSTYTQLRFIQLYDLTVNSATLCVAP